MRKVLLVYGVFVLVALLVVGVTYAAFSDQSELTGSSFSTGSADIKLLLDVTGGTGESNLADSMAGPGFSNIGPSWSQDYLLKLYNNAGNPITLTSNANYETVNDPDSLREIVYVEPFEWDDINGDGVFEESERGVSLGQKTIVKWKTLGFDFGQLNGGEVKSLILTFSTDTVADSKQGSTGIFDFEFDSMGL